MLPPPRCERGKIQVGAAPQSLWQARHSRCANCLHCTVSITVVVREMDPDVAVTVMVDVPAGVPPGVPIPDAFPVLAQPCNAAHASSTKPRKETPINFRCFNRFGFKSNSALPTARHKPKRSSKRGCGGESKGSDVGQPLDRRVVVMVIAIGVLEGAVPDGTDGGPKVTLVPAGLPKAENMMVFPVGPPVVVRSIVKPAFAPAATVIIVGGTAATLKSTPTPLSEVI